jgi:DNA (cytosine-5)-methyltransferase 1
MNRALPQAQTREAPRIAVEVFAGIGGFRLAADSLELKTAWANDIDEKACAVYRDRFGKDALVRADVRSIDLDSIPKHDFLSGGFPCQPFSNAGKKQGIEDPRGTLFQSIVDILRKRQPRYFVLENVKRLLEMERGRHFATILNSLSKLDYRIEWRLLNASHFGLAQNRQRVFIAGVRVDASSHECVHLADPSELSELQPVKLYELLSQEMWLPLEHLRATFPTWGICLNGKFAAVDLPNFHHECMPVVLADVMESSVDPKFDFTEITLKWLHKNTPVERFVDGVEILSNQGGGARMGYTLFGTNGIAPTLTASTSRHYERYRVGDRYRRLTNVEYARLQGFPEDHCRVASIYDQYILFGNAVPPPMARWVISRVLGQGVEIPSEGTQMRMALFG